MTGLTLKEQMEHPWTSTYALVAAPGGELRPGSPHFSALANLAEVKGGLALSLSRAGLEHPTTGPALARLRAEFLSRNLGDGAGLEDWLAGAGKEPWKAGDRRVELSATTETLVYTVSKARGKFWPFS